MYNVVLTGSSRGLGKAMANEFLKRGHNVVLHSKNKENLQSTYIEFKNKYKKQKVYMIESDLRKYENCMDLVLKSCNYCDNEIDIWINNAGINFQDQFIDITESKISEILCVNFISVVAILKILITLRIDDLTVYNVEGAGSNGFPTPFYSIYGSTKCALTHFTKSLQAEDHDNIRLLSPGMVMTDFVMNDKDKLTPQMKFAFNTFCETPEFVSEQLVNQILENKNQNENKDIKYLNLIKIINLLILGFIRRNRFFLD